MRRDIVVPVGVAVVSAAISAGVTYFVAKKAFEASYEVRLAEEIQTSVDFLVQNEVELEKVDVVVDTDFLDIDAIEFPADPEEESRDLVPGAVSAALAKPSLQDLAARNQQVQYHKVLTTEEYSDDPDLPEIPEENPDISVISKDIFMENGSEFDQCSVTYFADGGVLDEEGSFVEDHVDMIGEGPYPFGEMSEDPIVVYIRNKRLEREFEVIQDEGNATDFLAHSLQYMWSGHVK